MHIIEFLNLLLQNQIFYRIQSAVTINVTIKYTYNRNFKLTVTKSDKNYKHFQNNYSIFLNSFYKNIYPFS